MNPTTAADVQRAYRAWKDYEKNIRRGFAPRNGLSSAMARMFQDEYHRLRMSYERHHGTPYQEGS